MLFARAVRANARPFSAAAPAAPVDYIFDVTQATFPTMVLQAKVPVVLDCHAEWCAPCKELGPLLRSAVEAQGGRVAMAMLDCDVEQELSAQLQVKSLPTVFGVWQGGVSDHFVGGQTPAFIAEFVGKMAALAGAPAPAEGDGPKLGAVREEAFRVLIEDGDVAAAAHAFKGEYERLGADDEAPAAGGGAAKRKSFVPAEFDASKPEAAEMGWCLVGLARCALVNDPPEPAAVAHLLATLRDAKRSAVLDADPGLKKAVGHLALAATDDGDADASPLNAARAAFTAGDEKGALDLALKAVRRGSLDGDADAREAARDLVITFIDAVGAGPDATKYRRRLASALF